MSTEGSNLLPTFTFRCCVGILKLFDLLERELGNAPHVDEAFGVATQQIFLRLSASRSLHEFHRRRTRQRLLVFVRQHAVQERRILSHRRTVKFFVVGNGAGKMEILLGFGF